LGTKKIDVSILASFKKECGFDISFKTTGTLETVKLGSLVMQDGRSETEIKTRVIIKK